MSRLSPEEQRARQQEEFDRQGAIAKAPMPELTPEQIQRVQGTRNSEVAPWMSYAASLAEQLPETLESEIKEYAETAHADTGAEAQEVLARLREENSNLASEYAWLSPDHYADQGARIGIIMHSSELIKKLTEGCGLTCWYRSHPQPKRVTLLVDTTHGVKEPEVACWVQFGFMPEYSCVNFDEHGVVLQEAYRGWRTVLLQLLLKRMLTEEQATKVFGEAYGPASERYLSILRSFRSDYKE
jgi:hypothetical protein